MTVRITAPLTILIVAALGNSVDAQKTIPELARTRPEDPIVRIQMGDIQPTSLQELTSGAELVIDATLIKQKSYLTPDEQHIFTDYQVVPNRVLVGRVPVTRATPGASPLILTVYGGGITIDGFTVYAVNHSVKRPESGRRYLLFLERFGTEGKYQLHSAGGFEISGQNLRSLVTLEKHVFKEIIEKPLDDTVNRIAELAKPRKNAPAPRWTLVRAMSTMRREAVPTRPLFLQMGPAGPPRAVGRNPGATE